MVPIARFPRLNLPKISDIQIFQAEKKTWIWDDFRKKRVVLTPEEWVRQHVAHFLIQEKNYPKGRLIFERQIKLGKILFRVDLLFLDEHLKPALLVECKAPHIAIEQKVFDQLANYDMVLTAPLLLITNGIQHFCFKKSVADKKYLFLQEIPDYTDKI